jgi:hypothetical protein
MGILTLLWKILTVALLVFALAILVLILVNALRRTFFYGSGRQAARARAGCVKIVDFYAVDVASLPNGENETLPGMSALIDKGIADKETGIYLREEKPEKAWRKIAVPEVRDCFQIKRGAFANQQHTVTPSFANEIRAPSERQIIDNNHLSTDLDERTSTIFVVSDVKQSPTISIASHAMKHECGATGRLVQIINTSPNFCVSVVGDNEEQILCVSPSSIKTMYLTPDTTLPSAPYRMIAASI